MKQAIFIIVLLLLYSPNAESCVGKTLNIGVTESLEGQVLAELLATLVNERTGTSMEITYYTDVQELYDAVKVEKVDISIENTARAMQLLNMPQESDVQKAYEVVKVNYAKEKGIIWLKPFGFMNGSGGATPAYTATILRNEVLGSYPALPRLFNKLGRTINDETYTKLMKSAESGKNPKSVAKDFLKSKKLI